MLPGFICPGAQKAGTTTLYDVMKEHKEIYLPKCKETHFFDMNDIYRKGIKYYENKYFGKIQDEKIAGDITPAYMYFEEVPERLYKNLGKNIKIIFLLRNPVERAYSHYWYNYNWGYEKKSFKDALALESKRIHKSRKGKRFYSYVDRGLYSNQIKRFLKYFPRRNMKFILFEHYIHNIKAYTKEICSFLNVEFQNDLNFIQKSNTAKTHKYSIAHKMYMYSISLTQKIKLPVPKSIKKYYSRIYRNLNQQSFIKPEMGTNIQKKLKNIYENEIDELRNLIEKDLSCWKF